MRLFVFALGASLALFASSPAVAGGLTQPDGASIPSQMGCSGGKPTGLLPVFACVCTAPGVCNIGAPCPSSTSCDDGQHGTCESTMWHSFNDNTCIPTNHSGLDPWNSAAITPETFHPTCALTYTVVSRGTARFQNAFGWYNAGTKAPDPSDLHVMLDCNSAAGSSVVLDLTKEPAWKGGDVGFFLVTPEAHGQAGQCAGGNCCASVADFQAGAGYVYYSQREFNPDGQGSNPFIHLLIYSSTITAQKYYFGWEDTYQTTSADFTDLVTSVSGVECSGAGVACNTGKLGVCAQGVTECGSDAMVTCKQVHQPSPEACNGVDDDCNGQVDDGATCPQGEVCDNGKCVPHCGSIEYPCNANAACDPKSGLCVDPKCVGVTCGSGQICIAGTCGTPCTGVTCPHGQTCLGNTCIDLCAGVTCPAGQVCAEGGCVPSCGQCGGLTCASPLSCDGKTGLCADSSCPGGCSAGTHCASGSCVDDCQGARCPAGQSCQAGQCVAPGSSKDGGIVMPGGSDAGPGGSSSSGSGDDGGAGSSAETWSQQSPKGCGCRATGAGAGGLPFGIVAAVAIGLLRRRAGARKAAREARG
jgi:MYXO-CTERM domain-containing protein